ncbi:CPBP family intramembrane glutamic endopeptidase [Salinimicrobium catena]|uniref:CPBP family intramembrane glutamic endopeptidase n=1 Tax=Salinimicrobium catena TaxID=390640 RepID=UPI002FE44C51
MEISNKRNTKATLTFLLLTFALSGIFYYLIIDSGTMADGNQLYILGLMWCPGFAAIITTFILKRNLKKLGWEWGRTKYQLQSYFIPLLYTFVAYIIVWIFQFGSLSTVWFQEKANEFLGLEEINFVPAFVLVMLFIGIVGVINSALTAAGEEIGWRGFLVPELYKSQGFTKTSLISGFIWGIWHLPIVVFADYNSGTPILFSAICFMLLILSISFIYTWYRIKSGSLWTAVILHSSHNLFIQGLFTPITEDTGNTAFYIDEFGIILPLVTIGFAVYFWTKRKELKPGIEILSYSYS